MSGKGADGSSFILGYGKNATCKIGYDASGGGGGYYGGGAGASYCSGGGGGSGYIKTRLFHSFERFTGVREGNGIIRITLLSRTIKLHSARSTCYRNN